MQENQKSNIIVYILIGLIVLGGIVLWLKQNAMKNQIPQIPSTVQPPTTEPTDQTTIEQTTAPGDGAATGTIKTFNIVATSFKYDVTEIKVKKGDTVKIVLTNGQGLHDWNLDEFSAKTNQLTEGQIETISFVADKVGTFEYYCSVGQHRQMGMVGNLIVEE